MLKFAVEKAAAKAKPDCYSFSADLYGIFS